MRNAILLGLLACPSVGQDTKPLLILEIDGPDALRREFLPTDLGSFLGSQDARGIWPAAWDRLHRAWYGTGEAKGLWSYGGRIRVLGFVEPGPPRRDRGMVIFEPEGGTAWEPIQAELAELLRGVSGRPSRRFEAADRDWDAVDLDVPGTITVPRELNRRLVSFFGDPDDMDWVIREGLATLEAPPPAEPDGAPFSLRIDLHEVTALEYLDAPARREEMDRVYGLSSLRDLRVRVAAAGPRVVAEASLDFAEGERGLFAALMPESQGRPELLSVVPADAAPWMIGRVRLDRLVRSAAMLLAYGFGSGAGDPVAELRQELGQTLGLDLFDDLLAHLGDEVLVMYRPPQRDPGPPFDHNLLAGFCIALRVLNMEVVQTNFPKLLAATDAPPAEPRDDYHGVTVREHSLMWGGHWALTPDVLLISSGDTGLELLHSVLDAERAAPAHRPLPPDLARRMSQTPPGMNGMGVVHVAGVLSFMDLIFGSHVFSNPLTQLDRDQPLAAEKMAPLLKKHGLETAVVFTGYLGDRFHFRVVW